MSMEDLEEYEDRLELALYKEYRDVLPMFNYVVETERRFYLAKEVEVKAHSAGGEVYFELSLRDAWVWDTYRTSRFVDSVQVVTFKDVNVERLAPADFEVPDVTL
ncbi:DUF2469 domain-containing protein [Buchananella felis]|uniref:DUF2469 domain-containing protein n=1 Tax=Buchananella felis TaxID=3231492 RepID=UPI00352808A2